MFDQWPITDPPLWKVEDPPKRVLVEIGLAMPTHPATFGANSVPLRVRAGGLNRARTVPGLLYAWLRCTDGGWLAYVEFTAETANGRGQLEVRQWCSARAVRPWTDESGPARGG
ncbi:hypothetical protein ACFXHA_45335 [Nocardia sp. NPDC059240]|uniref:hypothetical protein n=1 Tax=Nocardia sp. NPDC059240 TaxID=3346786 RepID=UPI0036C5C382